MRAVRAVLLVPAWAACPATAESCGACPASIEARYADTGVHVVGSQNMRCTVAGMGALSAAGCAGACADLIEYTLPFDYSDCPAADAAGCEAWAWLQCAFPNDDGMHAYFFVDGAFIGTGFQVERLGVSALKGKLEAAAVALSADPCKDGFPDAYDVVQAELAMAEEHGVVLFGWDGCPCTGIAQSRFGSKDACYTQLTWSNPSSAVMAYLQCVEGDTSHHSFIYTKAAGAYPQSLTGKASGWTFRGNGFDFDPKVLADATLDAMLVEANYQTGCQNDFAVNLYGEPLAECRASQADARGSWMWDGKCTEEGGGVHQICMNQLPADFSVTTGQSAWSEERANSRHCVCVGAWSLYMTREKDPAFATTEAWPFCSAIPASALTSRYVSKWKSWSGIPADIAEGVKRLVQKCYQVTQGPGSAAPGAAGRCTLIRAFRKLAELDPALEGLTLAELADGAAELDCDAVEAEAAVASASSDKSPGAAGSRVSALSGSEEEATSAAALLLAYGLLA